MTVRRFRKILFSPLGERDNPAAIRRVAEVASENQADLTVFGVVLGPSRWQSLVHRADLTNAAAEADAAATRGRLDRWVGVDAPQATVAVAMGDPAVRIIERVLSHDHDLVVVTTDDDHADHVTIRRLLRKCPCPVWVIRPTRARVQRVMAAVNPDPSERALNQLILELAASLVESHGGELHLAHAWELYGEATMRGTSFMHVTDAELDALLEDERHAHSEAVLGLLDESRLDDHAWKVHLEKGPAEAVVPELVDRHRINVLVMGTVARTGVNRMVMGNTAERVLDAVRCSVIAVKPEGFVSPIQAPPT